MQSLGERDDPTRGHLEPGRVENLGADVRVQTHQRKARQLRDSANGLFRSARFRRQTELLVFVRGGNEFVRVRFDAHRRAHHHRLDDSCVGGGAGDPCDLLERVHDDATDAVLDGRRDLCHGLVVAVHQHSLALNTCANRNSEFSATGYVYAETFLEHPPGNGHRQKGLGRVIDPRRSCLAVRRRVFAGP